MSTKNASSFSSGSPCEYKTYMCGVTKPSKTFINKKGLKKTFFTKKLIDTCRWYSLAKFLLWKDILKQVPLHSIEISGIWKDCGNGQRHYWWWFDCDTDGPNCKGIRLLTPFSFREVLGTTHKRIPAQSGDVWQWFFQVTGLVGGCFPSRVFALLCCCFNCY